jgi:non-heme chloroperoxidase
MSRRAKRSLRTGLVLSALSSPALAWRRWSRATDPTDGTPLELPAGEAFTVAGADGAVLSCFRCGPADGPVVILAHGWTADRRVWAATTRRLVAAGRHVVVYDQRGHGGSTVGADGYTLEALADDMAAVLEATGARDVTLAGHSMGGMAAQCFADRHRDLCAERVGTLVLVSTASGNMSYGARYEAIATGVVAAPRVARAMTANHLGPYLVRTSFGRRPALAALRATAESFATTPVTTRVEFLKAIAAMDLAPGLPRIPVPVVIISGTRDTLTLHKASHLLNRLIPGSTLEAIEGAGHQLVFEVPDRLAEILLRVSEQPAPFPSSTPTPVPSAVGGTS